MFSLTNRLETLAVFPMTKELNICKTPDGYTIRWLDFDTTRWEIRADSSTLLNSAKDFTEEVGLYQREAFHIGSMHHRWIWFYEDAVPVQVRSLKNNSRAVRHRQSIMLLPQHFGKQSMKAYVTEQMNKRLAEYTEINSLSIFLGTWNCAGKPPTEPLQPWLLGIINNEVSVKQPPDIFIIGLQEMCPLTATNILGDQERGRQWSFHILRCIRSSYPEEDYVLVRHKQVDSSELVGILLLVFVKKSLRPNISVIGSKTIKLGFKGYAGNKGAVAISLRINDAKMCIINCHLAAHKSQVRERNQNVKLIISKSKFIDSSTDTIVSLYEHE